MLSKKEGRIEEMLDAVGLEAEKERGILWWLAGWENDYTNPLHYVQGGVLFVCV
jgi:hypothetical protein